MQQKRKRVDDEDEDDLCPGGTDPTRCQREAPDLQFPTELQAWNMWKQKAKDSNLQVHQEEEGLIDSDVVEVYGVFPDTTKLQLMD